MAIPNGTGGRGLETWNRPPPGLRTGSYFPSFLEPRRAAEKARTTVIQEAYVHGVSTRPMDATYLKVRQGGRIVSVADTIAVGVFMNGRREVLGMAIGPS